MTYTNLERIYIKGQFGGCLKFLFPLPSAFFFFFSLCFWGMIFTEGKRLYEKNVASSMFSRVCRAYFGSMYMFPGFLLYRLDTSLDGYVLLTFWFVVYSLADTF